MKGKTEKLSEIVQKLSVKLYEQAQQQAQTAQENNEKNDKDDVVDADYEVVDEEEKK